MTLIRRHPGAFAVGVCAVAAFIAVTAWYGHPIFPFDDAYTTVHDAQVLARHGGHDPNYLGVSPLQGETSLVHLGVVALAAVPLGALWGSWTVSWLAILAYALGLVRLGAVFRANRLVMVLLLAVGLVAGVVTLQLLNGMETGLVLTVAVWMLTLAVEQRHPVWLGVLCGVAPFVRPELVVLSGLILGNSIWNRRTDRRIAAIVVFAAGLAALPWLLWSGIETGHFIPNTVSAKAAWFGDAGLSTSEKDTAFRNGVQTFIGQLGPLAVGFLGLAFFRFGRWLLVFVLVFYAAYWDRFALEMSFYFDRYQYMLLPLALLGMVWLATHARWRRMGVGLLGASLTFGLATFSGHWGDYTSYRTFIATEASATAQWADAHLPRHASAMVHDAGYIAYGTDLRLVDLVGLKTPLAREVNQHHIVNAFDSSGRSIALLRFADRERPQYLVVGAGWDHDFAITYALRAGGWRLDLERRPPPGGYYSIYRLTPPPEGREPQRGP